MSAIATWLRKKLVLLIGAGVSSAQIETRIVHAELVAHNIARFIELNPLLGPPVRHFSQSDEDGIMLRILKRIGLDKPAVFIEFGVGNGTENNSLILVACGWRGVWIDSRELAIAINPASIVFTNLWVTQDNAVVSVQNGLATLETRMADVAVASIDLDGNDFHVTKALLRSGLQPDVLIVEYNAKFPPPVEFIMPYNAGHRWQGDDYFGVSLASWARLLGAHGYKLVACNLTGANAFFVKDRHGDKFTDVPTEIEQLFVPAFMDLGGYSTKLPMSGKPPAVRTIEYFTAAPRRFAAAPAPQELRPDVRSAPPR